MVGHILDGRKLAQTIKDRVASKIDAAGFKPGLMVILVGGNRASQRYVRNKEKACAEVGIRSVCHHLSNSSSFEDVLAEIQQANADPDIQGILLQLPLPDHINGAELLEKIDPKKDVDGFHPYNLGRLMQRRPALRPCTPYGIMKLLEETGEDLTGKQALVVGASNIVGRPMIMELLLGKCSVSVAHRFTTNLAEMVGQADILISAIGKPGVIDSEWIKRGAIVVDVGITVLDDDSLTGDIDFASARDRASWITPVPGGVGPMTVAVLLQNTWQAAQNT